MFTFIHELFTGRKKENAENDQKEKEDEMLVGRGKEYLIDEIVSVQKGDLSPVCKSIVYILEEA